MKAREFVKFVVAEGATLVRTDGDHHVYRLANGRTVAIPMGGAQTEISDGLWRKYRQAMRYGLPERG